MDREELEREMEESRITIREAKKGLQSPFPKRTTREELDVRRVVEEFGREFEEVFFKRKAQHEMLDDNAPSSEWEQFYWDWLTDYHRVLTEIVRTSEVLRFGSCK